ncbi:5-oxoprolinase subunit PxpA [Maribacter sp. HTCC2170]|uniref:5-oxoprolinase subunit PxpA n=1 Tax=Maribacter sp. (strain HTCC2170 / KCCM 42371) TaxID=313603 RepID=UPI00006AFCBB|nr:5-oxoprolinase subunit PxpA [Maribacter sp. HTCC2170]EAR01515.1 hypothetical protein FB2170_12361 [Maribacter sp. HTCC2170]
MKKFHVDINCDVGEGVGNEESLLPLISSCNIACGGHTGNYESMTHVVKLAKEYNVLVGAHPSYPDKENFGRVTMKVEHNDLIDSIKRQIYDLEKILRTNQMELHHIKPHGALYNDLAKSEALSEVFLRAIDSYKNSVFLYLPPNSIIKRMAQSRGFRIKNEAFADRSYHQDLSLVSRKLPNAVLNNPKEVLTHLVKMVKKDKVLTIDDKEISIKADTYCLHGDTPNALQILMYLVQELPKQQIQILK